MEELKRICRIIWMHFRAMISGRYYCFYCNSLRDKPLRKCPSCGEEMCHENCYDGEVPEGDHCSMCEYPAG
jgi:hypothetical protein